MYTLKHQRNSYFETLRNDVVLKSYPQNHYKYLEQFGLGMKIFKSKWNSLLFRLIVNLTLPFLVFLLNLANCLNAILQVVVSRKVDSKNIGRLFLEHSRLLYSITKRIGLQRSDDVWLRTPSDKYDIPATCRSIRIYDLLSLNDILLSYYQSILIHLTTIFSFGYKYYLLSFKSFEWCLIDFALRHINEDVELIYSNVCDRNAILYDKLPHRQKVMVQHGTMFFYHMPCNSPYYTRLKDKGFYVWNSLYKSSPSLVYCLSENDMVALSNSVIANSPRYVNIGYGFIPNIVPKRKSVLIVGHFNLHYKEEEFIVKELENLNIELYLKNHPTLEDCLYDKLIKAFPNLIFIQGRSLTYPKVDILISYDSTLAYEYESIGTKILFYEDFNISNIKELIVNILNL